MTWHPVNDSLEISLLGALWAGEGAKRWATFSGHGLKVWVGTDKRFWAEDLMWEEMWAKTWANLGVAFQTPWLDLPHIHRSVCCF
jgi:hypothetical protein